MLRYTFTLLTVLTLFAFSGTAYCQTYSDTNDSSVGGVMIDADGMLSQASVAEMSQLRKELASEMAPISKGLNKQVEARKISLKKLNAELARCAAAGSEIPESVRNLGGLTAIEYVLIYPEEQDVVLVGPAEGWVVGPQGVMVGKTSGKPVMQLEDLVMAIRSATGENRSVFSVSIDPTQEGLQRMSQYASSVNPSTSPKLVAQGMEKALGAQTITLQGIEPTSHFAYVLAAADFRMKQISMGVTKSPVRELPSFVSMMKAPAESGALPRWWLAPNYDAISRDEAGITWSLSGGKVVTMTDTDFFNGDKIVRKAGKKENVFQQWATKMTENYDELAKAEPIFGQLRNCMDCALVAAIFAQSDIMNQVGDNFQPMMTAEGLCAVRENVPMHVPSTSVMAKRAGSVMFVTGGVTINPWEMVQNSTVSDLNSVRENNSVPTKKWYAN